jgi:excisionase family DNA binding protein
MTIELPILGVTIPEASRILGCKDSTTKKLIREGEVETFTIGFRRVVVLETLQQYVDRQRANPGDPRRNTAVPKAGERRPRKTGAAA